MELMKKSLVDTTTSIIVESNTASVKNLLRRDPDFQWSSINYSTDATTTTLTLSFYQTETVSRLALIDMNWKAFDVYYNGATASTLSMTSTSSTTTSQWSSNSETSMYLRFTAVNCTSVSIDIKSTQVADNEKALGFVAVADTHIVFERTPSADGYTPQIVPKVVNHALSDGGTRIQTLDQKHRATISYDYITESFRDSLRTVYNLHDEMIFVAFPTTVSWDEMLFTCVWTGPFDFYKFSDNAVSAGFSGSIDLRETPT